MSGKSTPLFLALALACAPAFAQTKVRPKQNLDTDQLADFRANEREPEFYKITDVPLPLGAVAEAGRESTTARPPTVSKSLRWGSSSPLSGLGLGLGPWWVKIDDSTCSFLDALSSAA